MIRASFICGLVHNKSVRLRYEVHDNIGIYYIDRLTESHKWTTTVASHYICEIIDILIVRIKKHELNAS